MNLLGFFDYKTDGYQSEMFKTGHIVYMILTLLLLTCYYQSGFISYDYFNSCYI